MVPWHTTSLWHVLGPIFSLFLGDSLPDPPTDLTWPGYVHINDSEQVTAHDPQVRIALGDVMTGVLLAKAPMKSG